MSGKLKIKIENLKKDKTCLNNYVKCFCNNKKTNEVLKNHVNFLNLKNEIKNTQS